MKINELEQVQPDQVILAFPNCTHAEWAIAHLRAKNPDLEIYRDGDHVFLARKVDNESRSDNLPVLWPCVE